MRLKGLNLDKIVSVVGEPIVTVQLGMCDMAHSGYL